MFTPVIRLLLLLALAGIAVLFAYAGKLMPLFFATFLSGFLLWDYLKRGTIPLALRKLRKNDYAGAEKILNFTKNPDALSKKQRIYFNFIKGFVEREKDNFPDAENYLDTVRDAKLTNENDRAMVLLALADIQMIRGNKQKAKALMMEMKGLKVQPSLMEPIRQMQNLLHI